MIRYMVAFDLDEARNGNGYVMVGLPMMRTAVVTEAIFVDATRRMERMDTLSI